ncbi:DUF4135 domain-containing protein [Nocardioides nanhaiensis]|uniref:Lantibiotic biosynthesis protein dehydration domain-containing protein n=1 Tax=Nocardioides nanhaiensis TaxID=1476871 RepID=A0ABP8VS14_9ACTN
MQAATVQGGWERLFPELDGRSDELADLLRRLDDVTPPAAPSLPAGSSRPGAAGSLGPEEAHGLFGALPTLLLGDLPTVATEALRCHPLLADPARVARALRAELTEGATRLLARTLLGHLHAGRRAGLLRGATPQERFADFLARATTPAGLAEIGETCPGLLAHVREVAARRITAVRGQLDATAQAWPQLAARLPGVGRHDRVVEVRLGAGDTHGLGQSVSVLVLDSGAGVVCKPRDLRVEQGTGRLLAWLGDRVDADLAAPATVCGKGLGWAEHVEAGRPGAGWWRGVGVLLAGLYLLEGTDLHYENLLTDAAGRPVLVDTEAVLTPRLRVPGGAHDDGRLLGVAATGLLSARVTAGDGRTLDAGALAYRPGVSPFGTWQVERPGRDDMALRMAPAEVAHPAPTDGLVRGRAERSALLAGLGDALAHVLSDRAAWCRRVRAELGEGTVRYLHRPTMLYAQVQRTATHPSLAGGTQRRRRALGRLAVLAPSGPSTPWPIVASEVRQLLAGDLPSFHVPVRGRSLLDGHGTDTGVACHPPLERTLAAVAALDEEQAAAQVAVAARTLGEW